MSECGQLPLAVRHGHCNVHTKISVWCPAESIGLSSNDSAPDPVGTTFLLLGGFKSSVQLPTACKPEAATLSGCVRSICFSPLETIVGRFTSLLSQVGCQIWIGMQSAVGAIAKNPRGLPARDFWAQPPLGVRIQDEISSRLLCPHVDSPPGIRLILHFNKSIAPPRYLLLGNVLRSAV